MLSRPASRLSDCLRSADQAVSPPSLWQQLREPSGGRLVSIECEPLRQQDAHETLSRLDLAQHVDFILADAATVLPRHGDLDFALIDCEKEDYMSFFDTLRMRPGGIIVADNIISHSLYDYVAHVRARAGAESITLEIGKGLEVTRVHLQ